jgi:glycerophosphoryl diester phosphodiesterase
MLYKDVVCAIADSEMLIWFPRDLAAAATNFFIRPVWIVTVSGTVIPPQAFRILLSDNFMTICAQGLNTLGLAAILGWLIGAKWMCPSRARTVVALWWVFAFVLSLAHAGILRQDKVLLLCHRTANRDLPENTLQSLAFAARMGCDIVEVDVRQTHDGYLVLNHDGLLDRFTDATGDVETTDLRELDLMDFGAWMSDRFRGTHIAHLDEALRLARELKIGLYLDIKTKGIGQQVLAALVREGMTKEVIFGGEWDDIQKLDPSSNADPSEGVQPGFTRDYAQSLHAQNKIVIASFILNGHEFDLDGMKQAIAAGADGIMVDYPRLGAEAVGRPIEKKIAELVSAAESGSRDQRVGAIRQLSGFVGLPLQPQFLRWLLSEGEQVSHEAAIALILSKPPPRLSSFEFATHSSAPAARRNAAWAMGHLARDANDAKHCAPLLAKLLHDSDKDVLKEALIGLSACSRDPGDVPKDRLKQIMSGDVPVLRGLAAVALATHHPDIARRAVPAQLEKEEKVSDAFNAEWTARGRPKLTQPEIDKAVELYRAQMKELHAVALLSGRSGLDALASQAFRPGHDYSMMPILVAGFQLWDRLADDPTPAIAALSSRDRAEADWAEWALVKADPAVFPAVRNALISSHGDVRRRLIDILGWQADEDALPSLLRMREEAPVDQERIQRAIKNIGALTSQTVTKSQAIQSR